MDGKAALDIMKSFSEIMSPEDFQAFAKSEDSAKLRAFPEVKALLKGKVKETEGSEEDELEDEEEEKKKEGKEKEEEEDDKEKGISSELLKSLSDEIGARFEGKLKGVSDLLVKALNNENEISELKKSIDSIESVVYKMAGMPQGTKAVKTTPSFFEKAFGGQESNDENGKTVLSVSANKEKVLSSMEKAMGATQDEQLVKAYEDTIIRYNGGSGTIAQEVAIDLFETHGVRLIK